RVCAHTNTQHRGGSTGRAHYMAGDSKLSIITANIRSVLGIFDFRAQISAIRGRQQILVSWGDTRYYNPRDGINYENASKSAGIPSPKRSTGQACNNDKAAPPIVLCTGLCAISRAQLF